VTESRQRRTDHGPQRRRWVWVLGLVGAVVGTFLAASRPGGEPLAVVVAGALWIAVGIAWVIHIARVATRREARTRPSWVLLVVIPVIAAGTLVVVGTSLPLAIRFHCSRLAFEEAIADVSRGGQRDSGWIGLYPVQRIDPLGEDQYWIMVSGTGFLGAGGFVHAPTGTPLLGPEDVVEPVAPGWWAWHTELFRAGD
jgi:hypothetical protein